MKKSFQLFAAVAAALSIIGCASQSVYLQNLSVDGPQAQPPLFVTNGSKAGALRIAPRFSLNDRTPLVGRAAGHSNVNAAGFYQVDTVNDNGTTRYMERSNVNTKTFMGRNFRWDPSRFTASLSLDYMATPYIALVGGVQYSSGSAQQYVGANAGLGFCFEGKHVATRIDIGAQWSTVRYDVDYAVTVAPYSFTPRETEVFFYHENGKISHVNAYGAFTLNSKAPQWPLQFFAQVAINRQTLVNFDKQVNSAVSSPVVLESVSFFLITPGVYFDLGSESRLLLGVQLRDETELLEAEPGVLVSPFVQFEFGL